MYCYGASLGNADRITIAATDAHTDDGAILGTITQPHIITNHCTVRPSHREPNNQSNNVCPYVDPKYPNDDAAIYRGAHNGTHNGTYNRPNAGANVDIDNDTTDVYAISSSNDCTYAGSVTTPLCGRYPCV